MSKAPNSEAQLIMALDDRRTEDAARAYKEYLHAYGPEKTAMHYFYRSRILFQLGQRRKAIQELHSLRKLHRTPFGTYLFVRALQLEKQDKALALAIFLEFQSEVRNYVPASDEELPREYYESKISDLKLSLAEWGV